MGAVELFDTRQKLRPKIAALASLRFVQNSGQRLHLLIVKHPVADRDAKSMLFLVKYAVRQGMLHGLLKDVALLKSFELEISMESGRKVPPNGGPTTDTEPGHPPVQRSP